MAEKRKHINVTIIQANDSKNAVDLRIPRAIRVYRLMKELAAITGQERPHKKYQIKVKNKGLLLDEEQRLQDFPITNGDVLELIGE